MVFNTWNFLVVEIRSLPGTSLDLLAALPSSRRHNPFSFYLQKSKHFCLSNHTIVCDLLIKRGSVTTGHSIRFADLAMT